MQDQATAIADIDRRTLASQIYKLLERQVLEGVLPPGARLSEDSLAETFHVSRSPAREALANLERVGLAVRVGMRDRMITIPTMQIISEKYDVWWIVDVGRTYLASLTATAADYEELKRYVDRMARAIKARDNKRYVAACGKFHDKVRHGCGNKYINEISGDCDLYLRWFEMLYDQAPDCSITTVNEHAVILNAFEARNLPALSEAIRVHILRQRDRILNHFASLESTTAAAGAPQERLRKRACNGQRKGVLTD